MTDFNGILFSPATAKAKCSYCGVDLQEHFSMKLESEDAIRYICPQCLINIFDAVTATDEKDT